MQTFSKEEKTAYHYITVPGHPSDVWGIGGWEGGGCTITLQFRGIHPTAYLFFCEPNWYHYITVPGHPSDDSKRRLWKRERSTITLQFRGIHPTLQIVLGRCNNRTITLQFRGIHPTTAVAATATLVYHYITVPGHPSDLSTAICPSSLYHYITVPGHPSDKKKLGPWTCLKVPLHYSSGASIRRRKRYKKACSYHYITVPGHPSDDWENHQGLSY